VTAMFGGVDAIRPQASQDIEVDWICITDDPELEVPAPFRPIVVEAEKAAGLGRSAWRTTNLAAKQYKLMPWTVTDAERVIWIDANMEVTSPSFAREALACVHDGIAVFEHPRRACIYEEAEACLGPESQGGKYADQPIREQVAQYRVDGHPEQAGLFACGVIAWDSTDAQACDLGERWMAEVERWTVQDQLSFPVLTRQMAIEPGLFDCQLIEEQYGGRDYLGNTWLRIWPHLKKGRGEDGPDPAASMPEGRGAIESRGVARLPAMSDTYAEQGSPARYDFKEIDLESDSVHADVVRLVGEDARVLELGPATGYMSRVFAERGCAVVGVEVDPDMAKRAGEVCERVIVGDLDQLDFDAELGEDRFDVIVAADVLEHLKDPHDVLTRLRPFLKPDGAFIVSVPNVAHGSVRLALLSGHFDYREIGLLDSTHLRFFTRESLEQLLDEAELGLAELHRHELNLDASEVPFDADSVPIEVREELERDPDARTYQFVARALPMQREGLREIQLRLRELAELRIAAERTAELESALAAIGGREGELRRALIDAHDQLLRRDTELEALREAGARREEEIEAVNAELVAALAGLDRIRQSPPFRIYSALNTMPGIRALRRRRQAGFEAEVAKRTGQST